MRNRHKQRRFKNHQHVDNVVCQELLSRVWLLDWQYTPQYGGVPPDSYISHWEDCAHAADDPELLCEEHAVAIGLTDLMKDRLDEDVKDILEHIRQNYPVTTTTVLDLTDDQARTAMKFAISLWLHVSPDLGSANSTLRAAIRSRVPQRSDPKQISDCLTDDFCAKHLSRKGGIRIEWTDEIESHLLSNRRTVKVFRNHSMLLALQHNPKMCVD